MGRDRLHYTRAVKARLDLLPVEVRVHLETHLENLALLLEATPERVPHVLEHVEGGFITTVLGARIFFTIDATARSLLVHRVEAVPESVREAMGALVTPEGDP